MKNGVKEQRGKRSLLAVPKPTTGGGRRESWERGSQALGIEWSNLLPVKKKAFGRKRIKA